MERKISRQNRRWGVMVNFTALILTVFVFELIKYGAGLSLWAGLSLIVLFLIMLVTSFAYTFGMTGLWSLTHKKTRSLDERENQVVTNSVKISYSIFTIFVILMIYIFAVLGMGPFDVVIAATLLYLAHILPTSILAWTEKEV
jgi:hypothetical protein